MNGRIYDPHLGRMLQADPFIQFPTNTQSYNRYSYVLNNPLSATDPSGYFSLKDLAGPIVAVVGTVICGGNLQCGYWGYAVVGGLAGGTGAAVNDGNILQGVAIGAFTGAATYGVASGLESAGLEALSVEGVLGFGSVGGIASVASGGKFHHGFIAAGAGGIIGGTGTGGFEQAALRTIGRAIVGGTVSELTGGKFANGAATAAFASIVSEGVRSASTRPTRPDFSSMSKAERVEWIRSNADALNLDLSKLENVNLDYANTRNVVGMTADDIPIIGEAGVSNPWGGATNRSTGTM